MKKIIFCVIISINFSCKDNKEKTKTIVNENDTIVQNNKHDLEITKLPFGYEKILKNFENKKLNKQELYEFESSSKLIDFYNLISTKNNFRSDYKFPVKNSFDFDLGFYKNIDSLKTDLKSYNMSIQLPDINKNKVFIVNSTKNNQKDGYNLINNIDLIVKDARGNIIDYLNISHQYYPAEGDNNRYFIGAVFKYFYIDNNYIIHIKYFDMFEEYSTEMITYTKYKITNKGEIIRYFDKEAGHFKNELEEGEIKNHTKEGIWKEKSASINPTYYLKKYHVGILTNNFEVISEDSSGAKTSITIDKDTYLPFKQ